MEVRVATLRRAASLQSPWWRGAPWRAPTTTQAAAPPPATAAPPSARRNRQEGRGHRQATNALLKQH
eukprot:9812623-Lingulodinium_polyedra.AAC.1